MAEVHELSDYWHECTECTWTGWEPPEVNAKAEHLDPDGGACAGAIEASPPPTLGKHLRESAEHVRDWPPEDQRSQGIRGEEPPRHG